MSVLCDSGLADRRQVSAPKISRPVSSARICWNCSGYVRLRETCCPRCGAERMAASPQVIWQTPEHDQAWQWMKYAGYVAGIIGGIAWLVMNGGGYFG